MLPSHPLLIAVPYPPPSSHFFLLSLSTPFPLWVPPSPLSFALLEFCTHLKIVCPPSPHQPPLQPQERLRSSPPAGCPPLPAWWLSLSPQSRHLLSSRLAAGGLRHSLPGSFSAHPSSEASEFCFPEAPQGSSLPPIFSLSPEKKESLHTASPQRAWVKVILPSHNGLTPRMDTGLTRMVEDLDLELEKVEPPSPPPRVFSFPLL